MQNVCVVSKNVILYCHPPPCDPPTCDTNEYVNVHAVWRYASLARQATVTLLHAGACCSHEAVEPQGFCTCFHPGSDGLRLEFGRNHTLALVPLTSGVLARDATDAVCGGAYPRWWCWA